MLFKYIQAVILVSSLITTSLIAQPDEQQHRNFKMPEGNGTISGSVIDRDSHSPLEGVVITVYTAKDSARVKGAGTDKSGSFNVEVPYGMYKLEINYVGYSVSFVNKIAVFPKKPDVVLDTIKLKQGTATTEEIEVTTDRSVIEFTPEKKIFNVDQTPVGNTGTATDVLKNVPSVTVDNDGNVSLRGSQNVKILIDGRPVTQNVADLLESIPSSSVQSVELITNPSARYEAEGETGFINLVLKKNSNFGYNGIVSLSGATKDKYNGSVNLSLKNDKVNIYGNVNLQDSRMIGSGSSTRISPTTISLTQLDQIQTASRRILSGLGKVGIDYYITEKQTLGFSTTLSYRKRSNNENLLNNGYDNTGVLSTQYNTNNLEDNKGLNFNAALDYVAKFKKKGESLSIEANYSRSNDEEAKTLINGYYITNYVPANQPSGFQAPDQIDKQNLAYLQADYSHPFSEDAKIDFGLKSTYRQNNNDYTSSHFDYPSGTWVYDFNISNHFDYKEYINAAYVIFQNKYKQFGYNLGLRAEQTYTKGNLITTGETFTKNYISIFPSVSLSQKIGQSNELQVSYSRRINRPSSHELNPFLDYEDPLNLRQGNPQINPEFIDSYELSYLRYVGTSIFTGSVFYRQTHDLMARYRVLIDSITTLTTIQNISSAKSYGLELIANSQITKFWNFSGNLSYFKTDINGSNIQADLNNSGYSWTTKFITSVKLWGGLDLSVSYFYMSKRPTATGEIQPMQSTDVSIKKEFLDGKASFSVRGSDVFNTQQFNMFIANSGFTQNAIRKRDSQNVYLTFSYKFGNLKEEQQRRMMKKKRDDNNNGPDEDM